MNAISDRPIITFNLSKVAKTTPQLAPLSPDYHTLPKKDIEPRHICALAPLYCGSSVSPRLETLTLRPRVHDQHQ
ncbi:hypothetical protein TNCV_919631 [Trichonephila clavipes]|nr:hypothetical protein TNCV_919631 [Trichonephila clavipes]